MRKWLKIAIPSFLLAVGAVLCAVRWQAWFGIPDEPQWRGETLHYIFPLMMQDTTPESLDILVLGDIHNRLTRADYDMLAARVPQAEAIIQTGDWMDRGQDYYYQLLLREFSASRLFGLPVITCPGNHEYSKGLNKTLAPVWENAFPHPSNGPIGIPGVHYYIDVDSVRFIVIDTNPLDRLVELTRTQTWLCQTMQQAEGRYIVVLMHHPVLAVGKGRFNTLEYAAFRHTLGKADLVIAGHDHSYMRRTPFVILNTAGKPKPQHPLFHVQAMDTIPTYGVLTFKPSGNKAGLTFTVHRMSDGVQIDSLYVNHN